MRQQTLSLILPFVAALLLAGCGSDGGSNSNSNAAAPNAPADSSGQTNNIPSSLAGKTYSFTVTAAQGLAEPVGATYTINFSDSTYSYNPSPQNIEHRTDPVVGTYTYDPGSATVVLSGTEDVTGTFNFTSARSGTVHWMELDGEMQDANIAEL